MTEVEDRIARPMSLRELSRELGLSMTTVSRALNGYPDVSEITRARVCRAAEAAGYVPNPRARALATGRAMAIGHVLSAPGESEFVNPVFGDFLAGASETFAGLGYDFVLTIATDGDEEAAYRALAQRRAVDGVVLHSPRFHDPRPRLLHGLGLPFVAHGRTARVPDHAWVDVNNRRAFREATGRLIALGHRRIALLNGPGETDFARRRKAGYVEALKSAGIAPEARLIRSGEMTEGFGYAAARALLGRTPAPTAFLVSSILIAIGVRRALSEHGLDCPRDVSLATYDDDLSYIRNDGDPPGLSAVRSSVMEAGRITATLLAEIIAGEKPRDATVLLEAEWVEGRSTAPAPA